MQRITLTTTPLLGAIERAVEALNQGQLVIYPTETCYGIGADATLHEAVQRLRAYKGNRQNKPFSIAVVDQEMALQYVHLTETAETLYQDHLPGPLTVISDAVTGKLAPHVANEDGSIGIRIPDSLLVCELVQAFGKPITATSANPSDGKQPYNIDELLEDFTPEQKEMVGIILDAGTLPSALPTTIVDARAPTLRIIRQGSIQLPETTTFTSESTAETLAFGQQLVTKYKSFWGQTPLIFALTGEMGSGKTHLTKGIAAGVKTPDLVKSPSYSLVHEYTFTAQKETVPFLHVDAWRIENQEELATLGVKDALESSGIVVLEWAALDSAFLQEWRSKAVVVHVAFSSSSENTRQLTLTTSYPESI